MDDVNQFFISQNSYTKNLDEDVCYNGQCQNGRCVARQVKCIPNNCK